MTTSSATTPARRRLAATALSLTMVAGFAVATASSASAAPRKAKIATRPALARKAVVATPAARIAIPSAVLTPAPAWQTSG